jgi:enoyl-CoA hydratase/carnithine racemase
MANGHETGAVGGDKVRLHVEVEIAWITLNRPGRHNAVDMDLAEQLSTAVESVATHVEGLRGVVVTGAGQSFCSGADLVMLRGFDARGARRFMQDVTWTMRRLERLPVPTLALVRGFCLGGGFELALHCDEIIAADRAWFGFPEVLHGLTTTTGAVGRLVRAVGKHRAARILLSGERVPAAAADSVGLLGQLVPEAELDAVGQAWCERVRLLPPTGVAATKRLLVGLGSPDTWLGELEAFEDILRQRGADE